jgi:hypothetical protein
MPFKQETRILDGDPPLEITFTQLPATAALDLLVVLARVLGPAAMDATKFHEDMDVSLLAPLIERLFLRVGSGDAQIIMREVLANASVKVVPGKPPVVLNTKEMIDMVFTGRLPNLIEAVKAGIEVNYGNFLDIISVLFRGTPLEGQSSKLTSIQTSPDIGSSGISGKKAG